MFRHAFIIILWVPLWLPYLQVHMFIYTVVVPPIGIYTDFLFVTSYNMGDVLVVHIQILYYTHNILLLLTKQKLEFISDVTNMVILNK